MKVIISPIYQEGEPEYYWQFYRLPWQTLRDLGWIFVDPRDIKTNYLDFFTEKFNIIPEILFIWPWSVGVFPVWDYIAKNQSNIYGHTWLKCLYIDDLHHELSAEQSAIRLSALKNFDVIFASCAYVFPNFFPEVSFQKVVPLPHCVINDFHIQLNPDPIPKILLSGAISRRYYPFRYKLLEVYHTKKHPIDLLEADGRPADKPEANICYGRSYVAKLNAYLACFVTSLNRDLPYIVAKFFEVPASGSLMLAHDELVRPYLKRLGFRPYYHYIPITEDNWEAMMYYVLDPGNRSEIDKIRRQAYDFVWNHHTLRHRAEFVHQILTSGFNIDSDNSRLNDTTPPESNLVT